MNLDFGGAPDRNAVSRVVQGVITGIGFLGAGVIFRQQDTHKVEGMTTAAVRRPPPTLGEHTEEILREELGLDAAEIAALRRDKVI